MTAAIRAGSRFFSLGLLADDVVVAQGQRHLADRLADVDPADREGDRPPRPTARIRAPREAWPLTAAPSRRQLAASARDRLGELAHRVPSLATTCVARLGLLVLGELPGAALRQQLGPTCPRPLGAHRRRRRRCRRSRRRPPPSRSRTTAEPRRRPVVAPAAARPATPPPAHRRGDAAPPRASRAPPAARRRSAPPGAVHLPAGRRLGAPSARRGARATSGAASSSCTTASVESVVGAEPFEGRERLGLTGGDRAREPDEGHGRRGRPPAHEPRAPRRRRRRLGGLGRGLFGRRGRPIGALVGAGAPRRGASSAGQTSSAGASADGSLGLLGRRGVGEDLFGGAQVGHVLGGGGRGRGAGR